MIYKGDQLDVVIYWNYLGAASFLGNYKRFYSSEKNYLSDDSGLCDNQPCRSGRHFLPPHITLILNITMKKKLQKV
jgi:hypothetical protein